MTYDILIIGASFSGLTLARHLPPSMKVLIADAKPSIGSSVESTGLITVETRKLFASFFDIDRYITNPIKTISVIAPDFTHSFESSSRDPWIFQTDTRGLVAALGSSLPSNVEVMTGFFFKGIERVDAEDVAVLVNGEGEKRVGYRLLVGADGSRSMVAKATGLESQERFLYAHERVYLGDVLFGSHPAETIYHYWFGTFSLGYGGWLSPTVINGKPGFRIGLAKLAEARGEASALTDRFVEKLVSIGHIRLSEPDSAYRFAGMIPIGGPLRRTSTENVLLIGDAAGYCGAFAADGIKGSLVSGIEGAKCIVEYLGGDGGALRRLPERMNEYGLIDYYGRQFRYRQLWDLMKSDRSFFALFDIIQKEKEAFLDKFCDSKDRQTSLIRIILKPRHFFRCFKYGWSVLRDMVGW
jgi:digeranylgeranylglycerophospholipid reductase